MSESPPERFRFYGDLIEELKLKLTDNEPEQKEVNILLLGETGVGKSTFINAFANYLTYKTLSEAHEKDILALIPTSFTVSDENFEQTKVSIGSDINEQTSDSGQSATQQCKSFVFPFGERLIRLIDTPGIGDTRGVDQDKLNFEDILAYIGQFQVIHCICILLKSNNARVTITFEYCIKQLLSHLQRSASHNIVFVFTNTRSTFYKPGDTAPALKKVLEKVKDSPPFVEIVFNKETSFCLDNESFRFLVALKNGVTFPESEFSNFSQSWDFSANQCRNLIQYIIGVEGVRPGLTPHRVRDTQSVNEARRLITLLAQPLAEITYNIDENLYLMDVRKQELDEIGNKIDKLQHKINIPYYDLEVVKLKLPETVCATEKCCANYNLNGTIRSVFKKCHSPCDIYGVQRDVLGDNRLKKCEIFRWWLNYSCKICGCSYKKHLHVYYETRVTERHREDEKLVKMLEEEIDAQEMAKKLLEATDDYIEELNDEMSIIIDSTAKFAHFLQHNAIAPHNDTFKCYLDVLIEKNRTNKSFGQENLYRMKKLQIDYEHAKRMLNIARENEKAGDCELITVEEVFDCIDNLYALKNYGKKIREMRESQESARHYEISSEDREIRFDPEYKMPVPKQREGPETVPEEIKELDHVIDNESLSSIKEESSDE